MKNRSTRQKNGPYLGQLSVRWTRKKYLGVQKAPGGKKPKRKTEKKWRPFFVLDSKKFGAAKKSAGGPNGNVTPLEGGGLKIRDFGGRPL